MSSNETRTTFEIELTREVAIFFFIGILIGFILARRPATQHRKSRKQSFFNIASIVIGSQDGNPMT